MVNIATVRAKLGTRRLGRVAALCFLISAGGGCAIGSALRPDDTLEYEPSLLTGQRVFGEVVPAEEPLPEPINEPSAAMLEYVATTIGNARLSSQRFQVLFHRLTDDGFFDSVYSANSTLTAAETFEARGGNCLSYTNMFVALARAAGLDAHYQVVDVPPSWDADAGFLIRYTHINVLLRNVRLEPGVGHEVIVDFNVVRPDPDYPRKEVSDAYAESLFYANKSVALLRRNQPRAAFSNLRRAIDIEPQNVDLWINLGAFYATQQQFKSALEAYNVALQIDPGNKAAYSGLARSYANLGNPEMAAVYEEKVRNYREHNPYYHYAMAQAAYESADFERSLDYINTAISLKRRTARFHLLKGLVEYQLGRTDEARQSLERAQRYGVDPSVKTELLRSLAGLNPS